MDESLANDSEFLEELEALCAEEPIDEVGFFYLFVSSPKPLFDPSNSCFAYSSHSQSRMMLSSYIIKEVRIGSHLFRKVSQDYCNFITIT